MSVTESGITTPNEKKLLSAIAGFVVFERRAMYLIVGSNMAMLALGFAILYMTMRESDKQRDEQREAIDRLTRIERSTENVEAAVSSQPILDVNASGQPVIIIPSASAPIPIGVPSHE